MIELTDKLGTRNFKKNKIKYSHVLLKKCYVRMITVNCCTLYLPFVVY